MQLNFRLDHHRFLFFALTLVVGFGSLVRLERAPKIFSSGRNMPCGCWGFLCLRQPFLPTRQFVTDIVRTNGVADSPGMVGFFMGMLTVFVYARLWRKSESDRLGVL